MAKQPHRMTLHPFYECARRADQLAQRDPDITIYQQFECEACLIKNTIDSPNMFHTKGVCGSCAHVTNIEKNGCNYMIAAKGKRATTAVLDAMEKGITDA